MISNTDLFYTRAAEYQKKRKAIMDAYESRVAQLEPTKGSPYYTDEMKKATDTRDDAVKALKGEYTAYFNLSLEAMKTANNGRGMTPPTAEQLSLLQALKMREKLTRADVDRAVNSCKDNAAALQVLNDLAHKSGIMGDFTKDCTAKEMPVDAADSVIATLSNEIRDFLDHDTTYASRRAQAYNAEHYGISGSERPLQKRPLFTDKEGCYKELAPWLPGDTLQLFCEAVDGK